MTLGAPLRFEAERAGERCDIALQLFASGAHGIETYVETPRGAWAVNGGSHVRWLFSALERRFGAKRVPPTIAVIHVVVADPCWEDAGRYRLADPGVDALVRQALAALRERIEGLADPPPGTWAPAYDHLLSRPR